MPYELVFFDRLINTSNPLSAVREGLKNYKGSIERYEAEVEAILLRMPGTVFCMSRLSEKNAYVRDHQRHLVALMDTLVRQMDKQDVDRMYEIGDSPTLANICKRIYLCMAGILRYMEDFLNSYTDPEAKLPDAHRIIAFQDLKDKLTYIERCFLEKGTDPKLVGIVMEHYSDMKAGKHKEDATFQRLTYLRKLVDVFLDMLDREKPVPDYTIYLIKKLVFHNFNALRFLAYCTDRWIQKIEEIDTLDGKKEKLAWLFMKNEAYNLKPHYNLHTNRPNMKELQKNWIVSRLEFYSSQMVRYPEGGTKLRGVYKIILGVSVAKFACMLRLMVEVGFFIPENKAEFLRVVAGAVVNSKHEPVAATSFRNRFNAPDRGTVEAVRKMLQEMMDILTELP